VDIKKLIFLFGGLLTFSLANAQTGQRYLDEGFSTASKQTFQFDIQPDFKGHPDTLFADIYFPDNDTVTLRPFVVFMHGGAFISGNRFNSSITRYATAMAKRGYVVASIDYRLGMAEMNAPPDRGMAELRAIQDLNSFLRFAKKRAKVWGIHPNWFFTTGSSAGANVVLAQAFMAPTEMPAYMDTTQTGGPLGHGNLHTHSVVVAGVVAMAGAVEDTNWLQQGDVPVACIQSINDPCIPWNTAPIGCNVRGYPFFGGHAIWLRAMHNHQRTALHGYLGANHGQVMFNANYTDSTTRFVASFFRGVLPSYFKTQSWGFAAPGRYRMSIFPNPAQNVAYLRFQVQPQQTMNLIAIDESGASVKKWQLIAGQFEYQIDTSNMANGQYQLSLQEGEKPVSNIGFMVMH